MTAAVWAPPKPAEATYDWLRYFDKHRDMEQPRQERDWTCSACAIDWVARATALSPNSTRELVVGQLGYPACIDEFQGLKDVRCAVKVMSGWGVKVRWDYFDWDDMFGLCDTTTGILNNRTWYHYVAVRGTRNGNLWVANSAPGYKGIWDEITRSQFLAWRGSWNMAYLVP